MAVTPCFQLPDVADVTGFQMPFMAGATMQASINSVDQFFNEMDLSLDLIGKTLPMLAGAQPVITAIEGLASLITCVESVVEAVTGLSETPPKPPNFASLNSCVSGIQKFATDLLNLHPAVWGPLLALKFMDLAITLLTQIQGRIQRIQAQLAALQNIVAFNSAFQNQVATNEAASDVAANFFEKEECRRADLEKEQLAVAEIFKSFGQLLIIINGILKLFGQGPICVPTASFAGVDPLQITATLQTIIDELKNVREAFSKIIPDLAISLFSAAQAPQPGCDPDQTYSITKADLIPDGE
jgi:hypothetical protein